MINNKQELIDFLKQIYPNQEFNVTEFMSNDLLEYNAYTLYYVNSATFISYYFRNMALETNGYGNYFFCDKTIYLAPLYGYRILFKNPIKHNF